MLPFRFAKCYLCCLAAFRCESKIFNYVTLKTL